MGATELRKNEGNEGTKDLPWPLLERDYSFSKVFSKSERKTVNVGDTKIQDVLLPSEMPSNFKFASHKSGDTCN